MFRKKEWDLAKLRSSNHWDDLEYRYYRDLDFVDIMLDIGSVFRKRTISLMESQKKKEYSKAYISKDQNLLRIDIVSSNPSETFILYEKGLPIKACQFMTGKFEKGMLSPDDFLTADWYYKYDRSHRLKEMIWHMYPDLDFRYALNNEHFVYYEFEHDEHGLKRILQRNEGLDLSGKEFVLPQRPIFDRDREELLKKYTISKKAWIPKDKKTKESVEFTFGGNPPLTISLPICNKCNEPLTHICTVEFSKPFKSHSMKSSCPVFYCFECLVHETTIELHENDMASTNTDNKYDVFPATIFQLGISSDPEVESDALIKIGGLPNWIQDEEYPTCNKCGNLMIFVCQVNSDNTYLSSNQVLMFGDCGKLYTFTCCDIVTSIMQCY